MLTQYQMSLYKDALYMLCHLEGNYDVRSKQAKFQLQIRS